MTEFNDKDEAQLNDDEFKNIEFSKWASFFWSKRSFLIKVEIVCLIAGIITALVFPQKFTSTATLLPSQPASNSTRLLSQLSTFVGDAAISGGESLVDLYPDIARSRSVLSDVLAAQYKSSSFEQTLNEAYKIDSGIKENLILLLKGEVIGGAVNRRTRAVTISATTHDPDLSAALANEILNQMENFFTNRIKTVATSQRMMIENRLENVADSLKISEDSLLKFNESNRNIGNSPTLKIEEMRLAREVEIMNTLYIELTRQLEVAKISELKYKPILNILEDAVPPLERSAPQRKKIVMIFLIGGFVMAASYLKLKEITPRIMQILKS